MRRYPQTGYSRAFTLRVAQASLELGEYKSARDFAVRALSLGSTGEERRQALWVKGAAERYLHDYAAARRSLTTLITEDAGGSLTEGAQRMLAIVAEDSGDLNVALEQYLALNYKYDVAYFIDVLMTLEQLAGFIERHPQLDQQDELRYALGVRYLREHRWNEVRATMARVRTTPGQPVSDYNHYKPSSSPTNPKLPWKTDTKSPGVRETWVLRDLQTVDEFEARERAVELAQGDEAKAETMYQMASWLYQDSTLLFYNPKAWQGWRHDLIERLDTTSLAPNEARLLWEYSQKHEPATHALAIYLQIVQRYPKTRAARDALFTAVVCHERLADYNSYWRSRYEIGLHAGERMVKIREVKKAYPDFRLPRTRLDWEPATRTINGGPAWDPLPKPKPRPSFSTRVKAKLGSLWDSFWDSFWQAVTGFWQNTVRPWLVNGFYTTCEIVICHLVLVVAVMRRRQLKRLWHRFRQMVVGVLRQQQQARSSAGLLSLNLSMNQAGSVQEESVVERIINQD